MANEMVQIKASGMMCSFCTMSVEKALKKLPGVRSVLVNLVHGAVLIEAEPSQTPDELPILGPVEGLEGYLNACGHFRTGILNAPLTGLIIAELAAGEKSSYPIEPFLLSRFHKTVATAYNRRPQE